MYKLYSIIFGFKHFVCYFTCSFMAFAGIGGALAGCWEQFVANPLQMTIICCELLFLILIMINSLRSFQVIYVRGMYYNRILPSNASVRLEMEAQSEENQEYSTPWTISLNEFCYNKILKSSIVFKLNSSTTKWRSPELSENLFCFTVLNSFY